ncbi:putative cyclin-D7-1 [Panicum miliaceum]|uniref:Cyclin-D7-1 n=1 Tax=Panicum miliaceum TaxID=4540 RepID=A0A3L6Q559_PANMI|nr:putative cyclin-D7-1 [Panicum miliaceum]
MEQRWDESWMVELVSVACLSVACKLDEGNIPSLHHLQMEEVLGHSFRSATVRDMELTLLKALRWRLACVTPYSFLHYLIIPPSSSPAASARRCARLLLRSLAVPSLLLRFDPSVVAASAIRCCLLGQHHHHHHHEQQQDYYSSSDVIISRLLLLIRPPAGCPTKDDDECLKMMQALLHEESCSCLDHHLDDSSHHHLPAVIPSFQSHGGAITAVNRSASVTRRLFGESTAHTQQCNHDKAPN